MTKKISLSLAIAVTLAIGFCQRARAADSAAQPAATKDLILPGKVFSLGGKTAFVFTPAVLGRSRGGLWASAWAIRHPELTAGVGGIYPVYDWRTYPGLEPLDSTKAA